MMIIYGINACPDCVGAIKKLEEQNISYEYRLLGEKVLWLREFLNIRDHEDIFNEAKEQGYIGIPLFIAQDGFMTLDLSEAIQHEMKTQ